MVECTNELPVAALLKIALRRDAVAISHLSFWVGQKGKGRIRTGTGSAILLGGANLENNMMCHPLTGAGDGSGTRIRMATLGTSVDTWVVMFLFLFLD
jgi:hypothetical protein